jgi:hypothetical protein
MFFTMGRVGRGCLTLDNSDDGSAAYFKGSKPTTIATVEDAGIPFSSISEVGSTQDGRKVYKVWPTTKLASE